jgi:hypothetical protein
MGSRGGALGYGLWVTVVGEEGDVCNSVSEVTIDELRDRYFSQVRVSRSANDR